LRPALFNVDGRGLNVESMVRWDRMKQRAAVGISGPLGSSPSARFTILNDARKEEWRMNDATTSLRRFQTTAELSSLIRSRGVWTAGVRIAGRRTDAPGREISLRYVSSVEFDAVQIPERRIQVATGLHAEVGRWFAGKRFGRLEPTVHFRWQPQAQGSDYATSIQWRAGSAPSGVPYDELFLLGLDRDNDLKLRAHPSTTDGRKGASVMASRYMLLNAEVEKTLLHFTLLRVSAAPFIDVARTNDWFADGGVEVRFSVLSALGFSVSLGRDLRSGRTAWFARSK
jgi:hypothetical protein